LPVITVVCLLLLALLTVVQVAHVHPLDTAAPLAVAAAIIVMVQIETRTPVYEARAVTRYWHPQLFTRPPPIGC